MTTLACLPVGSACFEQRNTTSQRWQFVESELPRRARRAVYRFKQLQEAKPKSSARVSCNAFPCGLVTINGWCRVL